MRNHDQREDKELERFGVSMSGRLLRKFDRVIRSKGYRSRSEAIRDIIRDYLVGEEWARDRSQVVGTVTIVYDHQTRELGEALTHLQHAHGGAVICSTHVHLDRHNCLEVVVLKGRPADVRAIADRLVSTRGVKHGKLVCTTSGSRM
ncbi:MAG TPA: nickel-responsive transcriptional regulator NikR [Armatimonadota bacterium]|nr:nickel-responsive transcriptional regulator NikR [Armatimonadota bacterium]